MANQFLLNILRKHAAVKAPRDILKSILSKKKSPAPMAVTTADNALNSMKLASLVKQAGVRRRGPHISGEDTLQKLCNLAKNKDKK